MTANDHWRGGAAESFLLIGGAEDKDGECFILREFVRLAGGERAGIAVITTAARLPGEVGESYRRVFLRLGAGEVWPVHLDSREKAGDPYHIAALQRATGVFFTGGDQLRITRILGDTPFERSLKANGSGRLIIGGTSAGAAAMGEIMITGGRGGYPPGRNAVKMAPGLGLLGGVVIDQHFAQRGRIGRLLAAVACYPRILGIGIDEDTAVVVSPAGRFTVLGSGTVTVVDGRTITHTNASDLHPQPMLALTGATLHVLPPGYGYDLKARKPRLPEAPRPVSR
ncbi:cyanophycinase [Desulfofundulus australicus DSM 11792]|uniref:Cyanophycinase n=1 Tax=Desulfofundulus australicus DSM 11792 TaxID=1121425 RepID=A0A1M4SNF3_9FIRM|nr:cyanophycinase [Desulfofundulus australicus]SHE33699.1 cyanophycinase [Desulfofundulus australicus DSM 11792]